MAQGLTLPILVPNPCPQNPHFQEPYNSHSSLILPPQSSPTIPLKPLLQKSLNKPKIPHFLTTHLPKRRRPLGKFRDPNRGKPWSHHGLSPQGGESMKLQKFVYEITGDCVYFLLDCRAQEKESVYDD